MKSNLILCFALILTVLLVGCVTHSKLTKVRVYELGDVTEINIRESGRLHRIEFPKTNHVDSYADAFEATLIDQQEKAGFRYLCVFTTAASRPGNNGLGWCGSGNESRMVWLKLKDWHMIDWRQQCVESCFEGVDFEPGNWTNGVFSMIFSAPYNAGRITLRYDSAKPETGFILTHEIKANL